MVKMLALERAEAHRVKAFAAIDRLADAPDFAAFETAWGEFLAEFGRFLSKLATGSKDNPQSRQWYGNLKKWCRKDPLVQYLYQARNEAEHGLEDVTERTGDGLVVTNAKPGETYTMTATVKADGKGGVYLANMRADGPGEFKEALVNPRIVLARVYDKFSKHYDPPASHKGQSLADNSPITVAGLAAVFMLDTLKDASALPQ